MVRVKVSRKLLGIGAAVLVGALVIAGFIINTSINSTGYQTEQQLNAQYLSNQNELSACLTKIRETANITGAEAAKFEAVMVEAIKGRYEGREANTGAMFSAIVEQYPDLAPLSAAFERVHIVVVGCRNDYRDKQNKLLDMLAQYDGWRLGSWWVRTFGGNFPSENLVAQIGLDQSRRGEVALTQMKAIVVVKDTVESYESGELNPETPFPTPTASLSDTAPPTTR